MDFLLYQLYYKIHKLWILKQELFKHHYLIERYGLQLSSSSANYTFNLSNAILKKRKLEKSTGNHIQAPSSIKSKKKNDHFIEIEQPINTTANNTLLSNTKNSIG